MKGSSFDREKKVKLAFGVLAAGLIASALVAMVLVLMSGRYPRL